MPITKKFVKKLLESKIFQDEVSKRKEIEYLILFGCKPPKKEGIFKNITE